MHKFYLRLIRNTRDPESLGLFIYKILFKISLYKWKYFNFCAKRNIYRIVNKYSDSVFFDNLTHRIGQCNLNSIANEIGYIEKTQILIVADKILEDRYQLLGSELTKMASLNWNADFKVNFFWPTGIFYKNYIQEDIVSTSDVKVPRELSRCHHFLPLGIAYNITNRTEYAEKIIYQITDWIKKNPLMFSINWGCAMDVSIRACNWIWALSITRNYWKNNSVFINIVKKSLYEHGWFIYRNLEKEQFNNHNHYLADIAGQIHLGLLFQNTSEGKKWLDEGIKELFKEIRYQILPSGMTYERSTNYNRLVLELILTPIILLRQNGFYVPHDIWFRIERMFDFLVQIIKPDGHSPIIGDQDNGRLLPLGTESQTDYSYFFALGAILFKREDLRALSKGFNIYSLILGGLSAKVIYDNLEPMELSIKSKGFKDVGFFIMRNDDNYLLFNASGKGMNAEIDKNSGTHTHSDLLSFELVSRGKTFLIDPGSFVYTADALERFKFRSTMMHNTVTIDNLSQDNITIENLWGYEYCAIPDVSVWETNDFLDRIVASHAGYMRLKEPIKHFRELVFYKQNHSWEILDYFEGTGSHKYDWYFHFDSKINFIIQGNSVKTICEDGNNILMEFETQLPIKVNKLNSSVSKSYGNKENSFSLNISYEGSSLPQLKIKINRY
jgi:hypothetical protein